MTPGARCRLAIAMTALAAYPACAADAEVVLETTDTTTTTTVQHNPEPLDPTYLDWDGVARIHAHNQAAQRAARYRPRPAPATPAPRPARTGDTRTVSSTAYCLTGTMANGQRVYRGAVAMNGVPMGSRWQVVETGAVYTVADRIGHSSGFDIAMPGDCSGARAYGRRTITVRRVA
jgi:3D (Asp-Asp-Asp) domain-containing protein